MHAPPKPKSKNNPRALAQLAEHVAVEALTQSNATAYRALGGQSAWPAWLSEGGRSSSSRQKPGIPDLTTSEDTTITSSHNDTVRIRLPSPPLGDDGEAEAPKPLHDAWAAYRTAQLEAAQSGRNINRELSTVAPPHFVTTEPRRGVKPSQKSCLALSSTKVISSRLDNLANSDDNTAKRNNSMTPAHFAHHNPATTFEDYMPNQLPPTPQASEAASPPDLSSPQLIQCPDPEERTALPLQNTSIFNSAPLHHENFQGVARTKTAPIFSASVQSNECRTSKRQRTEGSFNPNNRRVTYPPGPIPTAAISLLSQHRRFSEPMLQATGRNQAPSHNLMMQSPNGLTMPAMVSNQSTTNPVRQTRMGILSPNTMNGRFPVSNPISTINNTSMRLNPPIHHHPFHQQATNLVYQQFQPGIQPVPTQLISTSDFPSQLIAPSGPQVQPGLPIPMPYSREYTLQQFDDLDWSISNDVSAQLDHDMIAIRRDIVRRAANENDVFFLFFHQLLCFWCLGRKELIPAPIRNLPQFDFSISIIVQWLGIQSSQTVNLISLVFAKFPISLPAFAMDYSPYYHELTKQMQKMLEMIPKWNEIEYLAEIDRRRHPWLVRELFSNFGIRSRTLMEIATRVMLMRIWDCHLQRSSLVESYINNCVAVFMKDVGGHNPEAIVHEYRLLYQNACAVLKNHNLALSNQAYQNQIGQSHIALIERRASATDAATGPISAELLTSVQPREIPWSIQQMQQAIERKQVAVSESNAQTLSPTAIIPSVSSAVSLSQRDSVPSQVGMASMAQIQEPSNPRATSDRSKNPQQDIIADIVDILPGLIGEIEDEHGRGDINIENSTWSLILRKIKSSSIQKSSFSPQAPLIQPHPIESRPITGKVLAKCFSIPDKFSPIPEARVAEPLEKTLHQAHLVSPILQPRNMESSKSPNTPRVSICQYVSSFALTPYNLGTDKSLNHKVTFTCSDEAFGRIAKTGNQSGTNVREVELDAYQYRVRCVQVPQSVNQAYNPNVPISLSDWLCLDMTCPTWMDMVLNNSVLQARQKPKIGYYKRDLPYDITNLVELGKNCLEVCVNLVGNSLGSVRQLKGSIESYWVGVEIVEVITSDAIIASAKRQVLDAKVVVNKIIKQMSTEDEDIITMSSDMVISVCDPFTSSLLSELPARSINCRHNECFSLEHFIESRPIQVKPKDHYGTRELPMASATQVDVWRCPICSADARPPTLCIDGWMLSVRNEMVNKGLTHASAIKVDSSGQWRIKEEAAITDDTKVGESKGGPLVISLLDLD